MLFHSFFSQMFCCVQTLLLFVLFVFIVFFSKIRRMAAAFLGKFHSNSGSSRTAATTATVQVEDIDDVSCAICLDVFDKPRRIPCGHIFCKCCLANYDGILEPACPVCRQKFSVSSAKKAADMVKTLSMSSWICSGCSQKVPLSKLRQHNASCAGLLDEAASVVEAESIRRPVNPERITPNRQTFRCPYCGLQNLDTHALLTHCNENHQHHKGQVVCPICASMPWGNSRQKSGNFNYHLNLRHRFEYDFVVDYALDDETALEKALKASLEEN